MKHLLKWYMDVPSFFLNFYPWGTGFHHWIYLKKIKSLDESKNKKGIPTFFTPNTSPPLPPSLPQQWLTPKKKKGVTMVMVIAAVKHRSPWVWFLGFSHFFTQRCPNWRNSPSSSSQCGCGSPSPSPWWWGWSRGTSWWWWWVWFRWWAGSVRCREQVGEANGEEIGGKGHFQRWTIFFLVKKDEQFKLVLQCFATLTWALSKMCFQKQ